MNRISIKYFTIVFLFFSLLSVNFPLYSEPSPLASEELISVDNQKVEKSIFPDNSPEEINYWQEFSKMMVMLGLILGVVLLIAWFLKVFLNKRIKQVNESNIIKVLERRNLSQKSMMYLIEVYNRQFLIGDSASGGVEFLLECTEDAPSETPSSPPSLSKTSKHSFLDILQRKLTEKKTNLNPLKK